MGFPVVLLEGDMFTAPMANVRGAPATEAAEVPIPIGSPTELAEDSDMEVDAANKTEEEVQASHKLEKRKRAPRSRHHGGARDDVLPGPAGALENDEDEESPSKRERSDGDDRPVFRLHACEMKDAWQTMTARLDKVEVHQRNQTGEIASLTGRARVNEKEVMEIKKKQEIAGTKIDALAEDVKNLKVQLEEVRANPEQHKGAKDRPVDKVPRDPWAEYIRQRGEFPLDPKHQMPVTNGGRIETTSVFVPPRGEGETLSEEDQRTLVVGGWMQDTRKATIELESTPILLRDDIRPFIDQEKLSVYGPRRSVGMLKFAKREGESSMTEVRERMWKVVRKLAEIKVVLESTKAVGEEKTMWAAFMKTKSARLRTAHISMVRRVTMTLAANSKDEGGGVLNVDHTQPAAYDMDWNAGGVESISLRQPPIGNLEILRQWS